jgi:hypothetical protein
MYESIGIKQTSIAPRSAAAFLSWPDTRVTMCEIVMLVPLVCETWERRYLELRVSLSYLNCWDKGALPNQWPNEKRMFFAFEGQLNCVGIVFYLSFFTKKF